MCVYAHEYEAQMLPNLQLLQIYTDPVELRMEAEWGPFGLVRRKTAPKLQMSWMMNEDLTRCIYETVAKIIPPISVTLKLDC